MSLYPITPISIPSPSKIDQGMYQNVLDTMEKDPFSEKLLPNVLNCLFNLDYSDIIGKQDSFTSSTLRGINMIKAKIEDPEKIVQSFLALASIGFSFSDKILLSAEAKQFRSSIQKLNFKSITNVLTVFKKSIEIPGGDFNAKIENILSIVSDAYTIIFSEIQKHFSDLTPDLVYPAILTFSIHTHILQMNGSEKIPVLKKLAENLKFILSRTADPANIITHVSLLSLQAKMLSMVMSKPERFGLSINSILTDMLRVIRSIPHSLSILTKEILRDIKTALTRVVPGKIEKDTMKAFLSYLLEYRNCSAETFMYVGSLLVQLIKIESSLPLDTPQFAVYALSLIHYKVANEKLQLFKIFIQKVKVENEKTYVLEFMRFSYFIYIRRMTKSLDKLMRKPKSLNDALQLLQEIQSAGDIYRFFEIFKLTMNFPDSLLSMKTDANGKEQTIRSVLSFNGSYQDTDVFIHSVAGILIFILKYSKCYRNSSFIWKSNVLPEDDEPIFHQNTWHTQAQIGKIYDKIVQTENSMLIIFIEIIKDFSVPMLNCIWNVFFKEILDLNIHVDKLSIQSITKTANVFATFLQTFLTYTASHIKNGKNVLSTTVFTINTINIITEFNLPTKKIGMPQIITFLNVIKRNMSTPELYEPGVQLTLSLFKLQKTLELENKLIQTEKYVCEMIHPALLFEKYGQPVTSLLNYLADNAANSFSYGVVFEVLIKCIETNPDEALLVFIKIKHNLDSLLAKEEYNQPLANAVIKQLDKLERASRKMALCILRELFIDKPEAKFPDNVFEHAVVKFVNNDYFVPIDFDNLIDSLEKAIKENQENKTIYKTLVDLTDAYFGNNKWTYEKRMKLFRIFNIVFQLRSDDKDMKEYFCRQIVGKFPTNTVVRAALFVTICQFNTVDEYAITSIILPLSREESALFMNEIALVIDMHIASNANAMKNIIISIVDNVRIESIEPVSFACLIYTITREVNKDIKNYGPYKVNLFELNVFPYWIAKALEFCRKCLKHNPSCLAEIYNYASSSTYLSSLIFSELLCDFEYDKEVESLIQNSVEKSKIDKNRSNVRFLGIVLRIFPAAINVFKSDIDEILKCLEAQGQFDDIVCLLLPLYANNVFDTSIDFNDLVKFLDKRPQQISSKEQSQKLFYYIYKYKQQVETKNNQFRAIIEHFKSLPYDLNTLNKLNNHQLHFLEMFPGEFVELYKEIIRRLPDVLSTKVKTPNIPAEFIMFVDFIIGNLTLPMIYEHIKIANYENDFYKLLFQSFKLIPLLHNTRADKSLILFFNKDKEKFIKFIVNYADLITLEVFSLLISNPMMKEIRDLLMLKRNFFVKELSFLPQQQCLTVRQLHVAAIAAATLEKDKEIDTLLLKYSNAIFNRSSSSLINFNQNALLNIIKHFSKHSFVDFLKLSSIAFETKNHLFIETVSDEMERIIGQDDFQCSDFMSFKIPEKCIKIFIKVYSTLFAKHYPKKVNEYIAKFKELHSTTGYIYLLTCFFDSNIEYDKTNIDAVAMFDAATNDREKIMPVALWARLSPERDYLRVFKGYMSFFSTAIPLEIEYLFKIIKFPESVDPEAAANILLNKLYEFRSHSKITCVITSIIANNIAFFGPKIKLFFNFLKELSITFSSVTNIYQFSDYCKLVSPVLTILTSESQLNNAEKGTIARHLYNYIRLLFNFIKEKPDQLRNFYSDIVIHIEKFYQYYQIPAKIYTLLQEYIKSYYQKLVCQSQNNQNILYPQLVVFDIFHSTCRQTLKYVIKYHGFTVDDKLVELFIELSGQSSTTSWSNAVFELQYLTQAPKVAEKIVECWPKLKEKQMERLFIVIWPTQIPISFKSGVLTKYYISIIKKEEWFKSPQQYFLFSAMLTVLLMKPIDTTYKTLFTELDSAINKAGKPQADAFSVLLLTLMLCGKTSTALLKKAALERLQNEKFAKVFFQKTSDMTIERFLKDEELKRLVIRHVPEKAFKEAQKSSIDSPLVLASNFLSLIINAKSSDVFQFVRFLPPSDVVSICYKANAFDFRELAKFHNVEIKRGIESISKELNEWRNEDFASSFDDFNDANIDVLSTARIALRHGYYDIAINSVLSDHEIIKEVTENVQRQNTTTILKKVLDLFADQPSYVSIAAPSKTIMKLIAPLVTSDTIKEYLVAREVRRFLKATQAEQDFRFMYQLSPAAPAIIHNEYDIIRKHLIELAPRVSLMEGVSSSDVILEQKLEKSQVAHITSDAIYHDVTASSNKKMITFLLSKKLKDENKEILKKLVRRVVEQDTASSSAFIGIKYLFKDLTPEEIKQLIPKALPYHWTATFIEEIKKRNDLNPQDINNIIDPAYGYQLFVDGIQVPDEISKSCSYISSIFNQFIESPQYKRIKERLNGKDTFSTEELSLLVDHNRFPPVRAPLVNAQDNKVVIAIASIDSQESNFMRVVLVLQSGKRCNFLLTPYEISSPTTQTFAYEVSRIFHNSPGSYQRDMSLLSLPSMKISNDAYLTMTTATPVADCLDSKESVSINFNSKREYVEWSNYFATRLAALSLVSYIRSNRKLDLQKTVFDAENAMISSHDFLASKQDEKFVIDEQIRRTMTTQQIRGPFRASLIAAADAVTLKIARFRSLGISLIDDEDETAADVEEKAKQLSLRENTSETNELQARINELISSVLPNQHE